MQDIFSQVQPFFVVEQQQLASRSYFTWQNGTRDTLPDSLVPNKLTVSHLVNRFHVTKCVQDRKCSGGPSVLMHASLNAVDISKT
jgi:hypothetical protein